MSATYLNPHDAIRQQDLQLPSTFTQFADCMRANGFHYSREQEIEPNLKKRLAAITAGVPIGALSADAQTALKRLQEEEIAVAASLVECGNRRWVGRWTASSCGRNSYTNNDFETLVDEAALPLAGFSLRLTILVKSTEGAAIIVPLRAFSQTADGTSNSQVSNGSDLKFVVVEPGLAANGFVAVTAVDDTLTAGQLVVVGYENQA